MRSYVSKLVLSACLSATACNTTNASAAVSASPEAIALAQSSIIVDGHIDVPHRVFEAWENVSAATNSGDFDFPRAKLGGLNAPFMSIYVPSSLDGTDASTQRAHQLIDQVEAIVGRAPEKFAIARSANEVQQQFDKDLISLPLGMENGAPLQGELKNLDAFYQRGIRYITLTHAKSNDISDSSYDDNRQWDGLSPFGETVVQRMNQLGIMVDISHVSDAAFYDTLKVSRAPVIASHSSLRSFTPGFERNMDDAMVKALAANDGIIMINFGSSFLTKTAQDWYNVRDQAQHKVDAEFGAESPQAKLFSDQYRANNPFPYASLDDVVEHIDRAVKLVGVDHVGIGSDYDGVGDSLPTGLKDVATYPNLVQGLMNKGYSTPDIRKILGGNLLRVWQQVETVAAKLSGPST
ncbi:dipeptidase [Arenicella xantha]|uniref:Membrane dipeptidase n=1 Tax=Arenicella xantha TaxID=644221 RepID=A0A395JNN8_9GAMM|nr:dipeptidase [Arenicella xantha]RBP51174.1 membrane dipeptidase [Arenicella xantha]